MKSTQKRIRTSKDVNNLQLQSSFNSILFFCVCILYYLVDKVISFFVLNLSLVVCYCTALCGFACVSVDCGQRLMTAIHTHDDIFFFFCYCYSFSCFVSFCWMFVAFFCCCANFIDELYFIYERRVIKSQGINWLMHHDKDCFYYSLHCL